MTDTVTNTPGLAGEVERLRELVLDLGQAVTRLTADLGQLRRRVAEIAPGPPPRRPGSGLRVIRGGGRS